MINYIRTLVSGNKRRFIDRKFDLDLSYITPRIIAMAFPGSGLETIYRNNIDDVANFLHQRHNSDYLVINLSGKKYDKTKFKGNVLDFMWVDHHAPPLKLLFVICGHIYRFLTENEKNVVVINCRAGKGRTGTIAVCFLLFSGRFTCPEEAFFYYSRTRFSKGEGVTQPSQRKYVYYFHRMLKEKIFFPYIRTIKSITLKKVTKNKTGHMSPYFEICLKNSEKISLSTKCSFLEQKSVPIIKNSVRVTENLFSYFFAGDITIKIYNNNIVTNQKLGSVSFNTAFLSKNQTEIKFHLNEIDPDNLQKNKNIPRDYEIIVKLGKMCNCDNTEYPRNLCKNCMEYFSLNSNELKDWDEIRNVLNLVPPLRVRGEELMKRIKLLLFGTEYNDNIDLILGGYTKVDYVGGVIGDDSIFDFEESEDEENEIDEEEKAKSEEDFSQHYEDEEDEGIVKKDTNKSNITDDEFNTSFEGECRII